MENIKENPKAFYRYARKKSAVKTPVGPLLDKNGDIISDVEKMTNILADQYQSVFSDPKENISDIDLDKLVVNDIPKLKDITITTGNISEAISNIPNDAVPGHDGVSPLFLKRGGNFVTMTIVDIAQESIDESKLP